MLLVPAYAKVNLALEVLGRRPDGFHELRSVVVTVDWHDLVGLALIPGRPGIEARLTGAVAGVGAGSGNLAEAAAAELAALRPGARASAPGVAVSVHKRLPVAAGLGGGSADAAAVLRAGAELLATALGVSIRPTDLLAVAAGLGSDVPALLCGGALMVSGRGERLSRLPAQDLHLAIAVSGSSSTAATYAALMGEERRPDGRADRLADSLWSGRPIAEADCGSALEPAARRASPQLAESLDRLRREASPTRWHLTGSGGAAFALAPDAGAAARLARTAQQAGFTARACRTVTASLFEPED